MSSHGHRCPQLGSKRPDRDIAPSFKHSTYGTLVVAWVGHARTRRHGSNNTVELGGSVGTSSYALPYCIDTVGTVATGTVPYGMYGKSFIP